MKISAAWLGIFVLLAGTAIATERYTYATISEVECADDRVTVFLTNVSGDMPPLANGYTNIAPDRPSLLIASTVAEVSSRQHLIATTLAAYMAGTTVRFRWEDTGTLPGRVIAIVSR